MIGRAGRARCVLLLVAAAGCASQNRVAEEDRQLRSLIEEDRQQLQQVQRQIDRLQRAIEEHGFKRPGQQTPEDRMSALEKRLGDIETRQAVTPPPPSGADLPPAGMEGPLPESTTTTSSTSSTTTLPPPPTVDSGEWARELAEEETAAGKLNVPERAEYQAILAELERQDCGRAVPQLNSFAAKYKDSSLADNALYWAGRCYQLHGQTRQAISKFYEIGTRYPKSEKAPAALWAQGNLFIAMGNSGDARLVLSEIIRKYPSSPQAGLARQKLTEIER